MLIKREQILLSYKDLLADAQGLGWREVIYDLPPFYCRRLFLVKKQDHQKYSTPGLFTGEPSSILKTWEKEEHKIRFLAKSRQFPFRFNLPLDGLTLTKNPLQKWKHVSSALNEMYTDDTTRAHYISEWTSLIIWVELEHSHNNSVDLLTSSSFPDLPHTTFVSDKAMRHIPPNIIFEEESTYPLKENLFHESLHQEMAALLLHEAILSPIYSAVTSKKIPVPWRGNAHWEPDRVLHAIFVYTHILPMRLEYLLKSTDPEERETLGRAISEGIKALTYLSEKLTPYDYIFTNKGKQVFNKIINEARGVLSKIRSERS